ncbi:metal-dependent phosphohydrolase [Clostridium acetobutylicum]|nr:metal-dependent phosphohydrolase [Clostridium acetobutylicum]
MLYLEQSVFKIILLSKNKQIHDFLSEIIHSAKFENASINILHAYSVEECKTIVVNNSDTALLFIDSENTINLRSVNNELFIVTYIRDVLKNRSLQVILRNNFSGKYTPDKIIMKYEINQFIYNNLDSSMILSSIFASLKAFENIEASEKGKKGLEQVIKSSSNIFEIHSLHKFAVGMLNQLSLIIKSGSNLPFLNTSCFVASKKGNHFYILLGRGRFSSHINENIFDVISTKTMKEFKTVVSAKKNKYSRDHFILYFNNNSDYQMLIYFEKLKKLPKSSVTIIDLFCKNMNIAFDNVCLNHELESTQKEIIFTLGEISEVRSHETGHHVKRVAEYSNLLALRYGLTQREAEIIKLASPMHDVGKLAIPDSILNKPASLTNEEFEIMKTHSKIGYDMLKSSNRKLMKSAAIIALEHHERFDGTGYPYGLSGKDIHIYGRITSIADVFDALGTKRVYKDAWSLNKILLHFRREKGRQFDPKLIEIFFENLDKILTIRRTFSD